MGKNLHINLAQGEYKKESGIDYKAILNCFSHVSDLSTWLIWFVPDSSVQKHTSLLTTFEIRQSTI